MTLKPVSDILVRLLKLMCSAWQIKLHLCGDRFVEQICLELPYEGILPIAIALDKHQRELPYQEIISDVIALDNHLW